MVDVECFVANYVQKTPAWHFHGVWTILYNKRQENIKWRLLIKYIIRSIYVYIIAMFARLKFQAKSDSKSNLIPSLHSPITLSLSPSPTPTPTPLPLQLFSKQSSLLSQPLDFNSVFPGKL